MGKSKLRKHKRRSVCPTGLPSLKELEGHEELSASSLKSDTLESIVEKLQSPSAEEKECAAVNIANMSSNLEFVASIIENKIIRIASPLLTDKNVAVKHTIAGCLRNLASCGDPSVVQAMVDQDIMTSLVALLQEYKEPWTPLFIADKIDSKAEIFLEACNLLWSICESSNDAVIIFNEKHLISILLPCFNIETFGLQIPLAIAHCLHTVAEDNSEVINELSNPLEMENLKKFLSLQATEPEHILLKTLAAGILLNVTSSKLDHFLPKIIPSIIEVIAFVLDLPIISFLEQLSEQIISHKAEQRNKYRNDKDLEEKMSAINNTLTHLNHVLPAKQIAIEIMTNLCFTEDSNDDWEDFSSSEASDEIEMEIDGISASPIKLGLNIPCEVHGLIIQWRLFEKVIDQIVFPPNEIADKINKNLNGKDCLKKLNTVRCKALLCLNNMIQGLDLDDLGGASRLFDLWLHLANIVFKQTDPTNNEQIEACTSSIRALIQKLAEANYSSKFNEMTESDLELLFNLCNDSQDLAVKINIIRIVGTIGCLIGNSLPLSLSSKKLISAIGVFLLDICCKISDLWIVAETLDVIFDVFAEDHLDDIIYEINLIDKISPLIPLLKGRIKQQRKTLGEHIVIVKTAQINLLPFIKYKNSRIKLINKEKHSENT